MRFSTFLAVTLVTALAGCNGATNAVPGAGASSALASIKSGHPTAAQLGLWPRSGPAVRVCGAVSVGFARCQAWIRTDVRGTIRPDTPQGYGPSDLQKAYGLTSYSQSNGGGETVAIVDAYVDPNAAADLTKYRAQYGLPPCTTSSGCFTAHALGTARNQGWAAEESLDVDMVSAICPNCKILLVEARSATTGNLATAEVYATQHANYVSNSWSGNEGSKSKDGDFNVAGVAITAATGDSGHNSIAQWPAILPTVIGVGGTTLTSTNPRTESAWSGAGSGCSTVYTEAELPERRHHRLLQARASRCFGRRESEHRRRGLRLVRLRRLDGLRRDARLRRRSSRRSSHSPATRARTIRAISTHIRRA